MSPTAASISSSNGRCSSSRLPRDGDREKLDQAQQRGAPATSTANDADNFQELVGHQHAVKSRSGDLRPHVAGAAETKIRLQVSELLRLGRTSLTRPASWKS